MNAFDFVRLTVDDLDEALELCDTYVGKHLYSRAFLAAALENPDHYFYLAVTPEGETAGYVYVYLTDRPTIAAFSKLSEEQLSVVSQKENPVIGLIQSLGIKEAFRHRGLARRLMAFGFGKLRERDADAAFGVLWKVRGVAPMELLFRELGFQFLSDTYRVWYDNPDLVCPYCEGRCECEARVYYCPLGKEVRS